LSSLQDACYTTDLRINKLMSLRAKAMRHLWLIIIAGVSLAGVLPAGEQVVDLSGTWNLDPDKSQMEFTLPEIREIGINRGGEIGGRNDVETLSEILPIAPKGNLTLRIVQTDSEVQIMRQSAIDDKNRAIVQKFALDGSQSINLASDGRGDFVSRTTWEKKKLIHSGIQTITMGIQRTQTYVKEEYSISKDGEKLTIKTRSVTPQGIVKLKQVFIRERKSK
jgi:hypothetical protein